MRYSWVADHFAYLSLIAAIAGLGAAAGLGALARKTPACAGTVAAALALILFLAIESNAYAPVFHDSSALWTYVLGRDPGSWTAEDHLGEVDVQAKRFPSGIAHYEAAVRLKPDLPEAHSSLGYALLLAGRPTPAITELREAIRLGYVKAHTNLGNALAQVGDVNGAIAEQQQALQTPPDSPDVEVNLANVLTQAGRVPEALPHYERALRLDPDFFEGRYNWAIALLQLGRMEDAAGQLEQAARAAPANARIWSQWGAVLARGGHLPEARERLSRAAELDPQDAGTQYNLGSVLLQENRPQEAIPHLEAATRLDPSLIPAWRSPESAARQQAENPRRPALMAAPSTRPGIPRPAPSRAGRMLLAAAALLLLGALVLRPVPAGGWLWDDETEVTDNGILRDPAGLARIWLAPAGPDYFPSSPPPNGWSASAPGRPAITPSASRSTSPARSSSGGSCAGSARAGAGWAASSSPCIRWRWNRWRGPPN